MQPHTTRISIIIPYGSDAHEHEARMLSATNQTHPACEIVVCENTPQAINHAAEGVTDSAIILLGEGALLLPEAAELHLAFREACSLQAYATFGHAVVAGREHTLPTHDPAALFAQLGQGYVPDTAAACIPLSLWQEMGGLDAGFAADAPLRMLHSIAAKGRLVHMAKPVLKREKPVATPRPLVWQAWLKQAATALPAVACARVMALRLKEGHARLAWQAWRASLGKPGRWHAVVALLAKLLPPSLRRALRRKAAHVGLEHNRLNFTTIYTHNGFCNEESRSGAGSTTFQTRIIRAELPALLDRLHATSLLDVPCGDFHWMQHVALAEVHYTGADIVPALIAANEARYGSEKRRFLVCDLIEDALPAADVIFCRDCLVHLPLQDGLRALHNIARSNAKWLITTQFSGTIENHELSSDGWRALNLMLPPFNLPTPAHSLREGCTEAGGAAADKTLAVWSVEVLREALKHQQRSAA